MNSETTTMPNTALTLTPHLQPLATEIAAYAQALPRLLAEGEAGRFALFKGDVLLSIWDTGSDAIQAGYERFGLDESFVVKKVDPADIQRLTGQTVAGSQKLLDGRRPLSKTYLKSQRY